MSNKSEGWTLWLKRFHRRNLVTGCYPGSFRSALSIVTVITSLNLAGTDVTWGLATFFQTNLKISKSGSSGLAALIIWSVAGSLRKFLVRRLLQYRGWLYEGSRPSLRTQIFVVSVRLLNGWFLPLSNKLYGLQGILPTLPLPSVDRTVQRYMASVKPLLTEEKFRKVESLAAEFVEKHGSQLQRYLIYKYWSSQNYVSDWWEEYVYLMGRSPLLVHSNFYCSDAVEEATKNQAARAAMLTLGSLQFRESIDDQTLKPLVGQGVIPLCSSQYDRAYNTTRVPGETTDTIVHFDSSSHVAVYHQGKYFHVPICHSNGELLSLAEMQLQFIRVLQDKSKPAPGEEKLAALTAWDRTSWAKARTAFFSKGTNKTSLDVIEGAAFVVSLDDEDHSADIYSEETPHLDKLARAGLHGNGYNRWCDKSFNFVVATNGRAALHAEHSYADAPIVSQMCQLNMKAAVKDKSILDDDGLIITPIKKDPPKPTRLEWDLPEDCLQTIESAVAAAKLIIDDVDIKVLSHRPFGKGLMKKCKVSPDAFIQMALQLAYYRVSGKFDLTYEAAMTRFYKCGRTETVRSCTEESCKWVRAMDSDATEKEKLELFKEAWEKHQLNYRLSMSGEGFDRHLFALYVVSKYLKIDSEFLKEALGAPWKLSTSQTPTWQESVNEVPFITSGGGFGATCPDGYGVSYIVGGDHALVFHVSSYKSCPTTDSTKFTNEIARALDDIRLLFGVDLEENEIFKKSS